MSRAPQSAEPVLELHALHKSFGETQIIRGVDLTVTRNQRHALIGPNGAGKSTLFNLISGHYVPTSGDILLDRPVDLGSAAASHQPARPLALVPDHRRVSAHERGGEPSHLRDGTARPPPHPVPADQQPARGQRRGGRFIEKLRLTKRRDDLAGDLAYSEQRTLEIGMSLATDPSILLLDEPTAGMSREETAYIVELIRTVTEAARCWSSSTT